MRKKFLDISKIVYYHRTVIVLFCKKCKQKFKFAGVVELADMRDLGSRAEWRAGSSPVTRINKNRFILNKSVFLLLKIILKGI